MENIKFAGKVIAHLLKKYKKETAVITGLFLLVVGIGVTCAFNATKELKVVIDPNTTAASEQTEKVDAILMDTVGEVLEAKGVDTSDDYVVSVDLDKKVKDVDTVTIKKKAAGTLTVDGQTIDYKSGAETVGELLADNDVQVDDDDIVTPAADTELTTEVAAVSVARIEVKEEAGQRDLPFETEKRENADLEEGTEQIVTQGVYGKEDFVDKVTYQDGVEIARENISKTVSVEPVKAVVDVGTKKVVSEAASATANASTGNATASTGDSFDFICAVVASECNSSYEGALAVISCVMNRVDSGRWGGSDAVSVLTASGQFSGYLDGYYSRYTGGNYPDYVAQAVRDCMEGGVRNHSYERFRAASTGVSGVNIGGNVYF